MDVCILKHPVVADFFSAIDGVFTDEALTKRFNFRHTYNYTKLQGRLNLKFHVKLRQLLHGIRYELGHGVNRADFLRKAKT